MSLGQRLPDPDPTGELTVALIGWDRMKKWAETGVLGGYNIFRNSDHYHAHAPRTDQYRSFPLTVDGFRDACEWIEATMKVIAKEE